jgi:non-ribosomal peptide synthetase component F
MKPLTSGPAATSAVVSGPGGAGRGAVAGQADSLVIPGVTLPEFVLGQARQRGGKRALVDATTGRTLTYRELAIDVRRVGAGLAAHGVQPGDVVALCAPNSIEFVVAWYAASMVGATLTTLNPAFRGEEIAQLLREARARWLVTSVELFEEKVGLCAVAAGVRQTFVLGAADRSPMGAIPFASLYSEIDADVPAVRVGPADVAFLPWSSGTSGLPKSVVLTHRNLVASLCQTRPVHQVGEDDVVIAALPLFHAFGFQVTLNLSLLQGSHGGHPAPVRARCVPQGRAGPRRYPSGGRPADRPGPRDQRPRRRVRRLEPSRGDGRCRAAGCRSRAYLRSADRLPPQAGVRHDRARRLQPHRA